MDFLNQCSKKAYPKEEVLHKHHIIPRHLGGDNQKENIILLSVQDHAKAHLLLAECFEEWMPERIKKTLGLLE